MCDHDRSEAPQQKPLTALNCQDVNMHHAAQSVRMKRSSVEVSLLLLLSFTLSCYFLFLSLSHVVFEKCLIKMYVQ